MKFDGYRMQAHINDGMAYFFTRNALDWSNSFPHLLNAIEKLSAKNAIIDGEIVALDEEGKSHFQKLQNTLKSKNDTHLVYYAFDLLYLNGKDLRSLPLLERKKMLKKLLSSSTPNIQYSDHVTEQGQDFYRLSCEHKLEGIVSKREDSPYHSGRNDLWVKTKCSARQEFVIGGWTEPQGGRSGIGALLLGIYEKKKLRYAGRVGTGFTHKMLREILNELAPLEQHDSPFAVNSPKGKGIHWVNPLRVCEVSFGNWTEEGILRTPVFQGMREDKPAKDILREVSSPDKILFKKEKITKQMVLEFYLAIARKMIPYVAGRPLSLVRCPNGSEGTCFYQKHISGTIPDSFKTISIKENKGVGIYLSIDSAEGLGELVQLNAFEIHAWNSHRDNYQRPDQIVMDLDPGQGVAWTDVVNAAFELKEMLSDLDLESFVKLTGGKGLHIHIPVAPLYDWDQIKSFSQTLAREMVARHPEKYVSTMSKKVRKNKIFIDYFRNGFGATTVAPYSLRAKPESAVALPLSWMELKKMHKLQTYTLQMALKKIKARKKDPWEGMLKLKQKISILKPVSRSAR